MPNVRPIIRPLARDISRSIVHGSAFNPLSLFANGEQGAWYDPSDLTTLYQDAEGTTPVTADGDPVGLMLDKSGNGNHASQSVAASRPIYRTDGTLHWLEGDGVDSELVTASFLFTQPYSFFVAAKASNPNRVQFLADGLGTNSSSLITLSDGTVRAYAGTGVVTTDILDTNPHVISAIFDGVSSMVAIDASEVFGDAGASNAGGLFILGGSGAAVEWLGTFYGGVFVGGARPITERKDVRQYLAQKAGVTL